MRKRMAPTTASVFVVAIIGSFVLRPKRGGGAASAFAFAATTTAATGTTASSPSSSVNDAAKDCASAAAEERYSAAEWEQRCSLAAAYRIAHLEGWGMNIFNHITLKVDGSEDEPDGPYFLLNDYGRGFDEVTASNLLKVNLDGERIMSFDGEEEGKVFKPGYVIHSAIHGGRPDVHAVWHTHDPDAVALCQTKIGLLPISQEATYALTIGVSYHPFEGTANDESERDRLVDSLGPTNSVLLLEDHGPLVATSTIQGAYQAMFFVTRAAKYQVRALSAVGGDLTRIHVPSDQLQEDMFRRMEKFDEAPGDRGVEHDTEGLMFAYARRQAERAFGAEDIYR